MSDEQVVDAVLEDVPNVVEELPEEPKPKEGMTLEDLKVGYVVGLSPDGNFIFEAVGKEQGLVEMLGIHYHAKRVLETAYNEKRGLGDKLTVEVGRILLQLTDKVDTLSKELLPQPKPDNEL